MTKNRSANPDRPPGCSLVVPIAVFVAVLCITLNFGLWPFRFFPTNDARISTSGSCVVFHGWSIAAPASMDSGKGFYSSDITLTPYKSTIKDYLGHLFSLYDVQTGIPWLIAGQWRSDLVVRLLRKDPESGKLSYVENGIDSLFTEKRPFKMLIRYDSTGISVRANETALFEKRGWHGPVKGSWIFGVSPFGTEPWPGLICIETGMGTAAPGWTVPPRFTPPFHRVLAPFWRDFSLSAWFVRDMIINLIGFLPFGFSFVFLFWGRVRSKRAGLLIAVFFASLGVTLVIELAQVAIPFRTSQLSDVILNTIGGVIGGAIALLFRPSAISRASSASRTS